MRFVTLAAVCAAALMIVPAASPRQAGTINICAHYAEHTYEACFAYWFNDSGMALRRYYRDANSEDPYDSTDAAEDFAYRFRGPAYRTIKQMVAKWPLGVNDVSVPKISIISAASSLAFNRAVLTTRESWRVTDHDGHVLLPQTIQLRHVTMCRIQGKLLHIWVVVKLSADPSYDCLQYPH